MALSCIDLRDKARYWLKIVIFFTYPLHSTPQLWGSRRNIAITLGMEKLERCGYPAVKRFDSLAFSTKYQRVTDRLTGGRTDRQTSCHGIVRAYAENRAAISLNHYANELCTVELLSFINGERYIEMPISRPLEQNVFSFVFRRYFKSH